MTDFKLPELGENITAGDVVRVLVKAGDTIAKDQPVIELETDKATIEVPSSVAGVVKDVQVKPEGAFTASQYVHIIVSDTSSMLSVAPSQAVPCAADEKQKCSARATPLVYTLPDGREMVAVAAGGHDTPLSKPGTTLHVFTLPAQ